MTGSLSDHRPLAYSEAVMLDGGDLCLGLYGENISVVLLSGVRNQLLLVLKHLSEDRQEDTATGRNRCRDYFDIRRLKEHFPNPTLAASQTLNVRSFFWRCCSFSVRRKIVIIP